MNLFSTITFRLASAIFVGFTFLIAAAFAVQYTNTNAILEQRQATVLKTEFDALASLYQQRRIVAVRQALELRSISTPPNDQIFLLQDRNGIKLAGNIDSWPQSLIPQDGLFKDATPTTYRPIEQASEFDVLAINLPGGFPILFGISRAQLQLEKSKNLNLVYRVLAGFTFLSVLVSTVISKTVLTRFKQLIFVANQVAAGKFDTRFGAPYGNDEVGRLHRHMDDMLDQIENLTQANHKLSNSIAHELRTPLNRINQKLENIKGQSDLVTDVRNEIHQIVRVFDSLLSISAAETKRSGSLNFLPINLTELCENIYDLYEPSADENGLKLETTLDADIWILGDQSLVSQMLSNLIENSIKFCQPKDTIRIELVHNGATAKLTVLDSGPGLPSDIATNPFEPFVRGQHDKHVSGHGLGLSLVRAIAISHGAKLKLPVVKNGFSVEINWKEFNKKIDTGGL